MKNILLLSLLICLLACSTKKSSTSATKENIQGTWQDTLDGHILYFAGSTYQITFANDSFRSKEIVFSDILIANCMDSTNYTNYVKGNYTLHNDSLFLSGIYCDSFYNVKTIAGCSTNVPIGALQNSFTINLVNGKLQLGNYHFHHTLFKQ